MKKLLLSAAIVATTMFVACGPSAEEIAKKEKATADSLAKVEEEKMQAEAEAMAAKATADSLAMAAQAQATADSLAKAEEEARGEEAGVPSPTDRKIPLNRRAMFIEEN